MASPRIMVLLVCAQACSIEALEGDDDALFQEQLNKVALKKIVIARMYQRNNWTIPAADDYRADELANRNDRRIAYVCDAIAPLKPTYVSGLIRLDDDQEITDDHVAIWNGVRACIDGRVDHKVRYDVVLNALHYTSKQYKVSSSREGKRRLFDRLESANQKLDPDGYFFDFYSTPWTDEEFTQHPNALLEGIQRIRGGDRFVGGNVWGGVVPRGSHFVSITDRGGRDNVVAHMQRLRGAGVPVLMHIRNDPHIAGSEGRRWNERGKRYRRKILRRHVRWGESSGYKYMYPVFFPLTTGRVSYDAMADGMIDRIRDYMRGDDNAKKMASPDGEDAAPTALDPEDDGLIEVARAFNGGAEQHLFSRDLFEVTLAAGLALEAEGYFGLARAPAPGTDPLHRCYLGSGWHLLTVAPACEGNAGGIDEGVIGHIARAPQPGTVPLHRLHRADVLDHFFTTSAAERDLAVTLGYVDEGVVGHVWDEQGFGVLDTANDRVAIHRAFQGQEQQHLYSLSLEEIAGGGGLALEYANYFYLDRAPSAGTQPFHRCYLGSGWHLLTGDPTCEGADGAINEGVLGHIQVVPSDGALPLHRLFRASVLDHFYTTSAPERDYAVSLGYVDEGVVGYVHASP